MSSIGKRLKQARESKGLLQRELAELASVSPNYITRFESDEFKNPTIETIEKFAKVLKIHPNELLYGEPLREFLEPPPEFKKYFRFIPLLSGRVSIKDFQDAPNEWDGETLPIAKEVRGKSLVAWKVQGHSMEPNFLEGDDIIINLDFDKSSLDNCDAIVCIDKDEIAFKNMRVFKDVIELRPYNLDYPTIKFTKKEMNEKKFQIIGTVVGFHRNEMRRKK